MSLLEAKNLSHRFPNGSYGLKNVGFSVETGDFLVVTGANGSGKTLLMRHLNGLLAPTSGSVLYRGTDIRKNLTLVREKIGLVFQDADSQIVAQTVRDDVDFGPGNLGLPANEIETRRERALGVTGLARHADSRSRLLSGGEKRLLAIAGVLAMEPEVIVFDEPFANLDFPAVRRIITLLLELHRSGRTVILITHELEKILSHANRLIIMRSGELVRNGSPGDLFPLLSEFDLVSSRFLEGSLEEMTWLR